MSNPLWFKDAVIYELHIKTFADSNADGIGDFRGLTEKLSYFEDLGVTALWILPFYPSPLRDDGYDIADYLSVNPSYGTLEDFQTFLAEAHARGLRVITELVLNHTSDQNPWFQRARRAPAGSRERDYYVWSDDPKKYSDARIIFKDFEPSNWTWDPVAKSYFWHRFFNHQPDLNFDNPAVHESLFKVIDFWLEMGVDGVRLDAVPYLYEREGTNCENLPETHAFLKKLRAHIDGKFEDRMLLAEANQWPEDSAAYFGNGDECHMNFHFPLMPRMFMALQMEDRYPLIDIIEQTPAIPANCSWGIFLRNHDELTLEMVTDEERDYMYRVYASDPRARINLGIRRRLAPLLGNNRRKMELINSLLFSLPGTPVIYYGDEIGMGDNFYLGDRNGVRTPMQWSADRNAGFSKCNPQQLFLPVIIDPEYHYESVNVENQQGNLSSLFWWMRRMIAIARAQKAFTQGAIEFLHPDNPKVFAFVRRHEEQNVLVIANLSRFTQATELDLSAFAGLVPEELFGHSKFPEIRQTPIVFTVGPHGFYWLALRPSGVGTPGEAERQIPTLAAHFVWGERLNDVLEREILPSYLQTCRWFGGKGRVMRQLRVVDDIPLGSGSEISHVLLVEAAFTDGLPDTYLIPLSIAQPKRGAQLVAESPQAVVAKFDDGRVLHDAVHDAAFRSELLRLVAAGKSPRGRAKITGERGQGFDGESTEKLAAASRVLKAEQSNSSVLFGDAYFLKLYRKVESGPQPDVEITRFLSEERGFAHVPSFGGSVRIKVPAGGDAVIALLVGQVQNQGDGWNYTLDALDRYYERVLAARADASDTQVVSDMIGGVYPERARQLGLRTGEMHIALTGSDEETAFAPEPFSTLYQRSLYQALRGSLGRTLRMLKRQLPQLSEESRAAASSVLESHDHIITRYARLLERKIEATKIPIHGDYHLGQVLNTGKDFLIIDFEGEPRRALGERNLKRSPLVDVAGMLRSFDYAAYVGLTRQRAEDAKPLEPWAEAWSQRVAQTFLAAYREATKAATFLPPDERDFNVLLESFILDKAVYEIGYEITYRPDWVQVPVRAVMRLVQPSTSTNTTLFPELAVS